MKALALTLTLAASIFTANHAQALVHVPGTFVPSQCGPQQFESTDPVVNSIEIVCVGKIAGHDGDAVRFEMADGSNKVFHVQHTANLLLALKSGSIKANYFLVSDEGERTTMRVIETREGRILAVSGQLGDVGYFVPQMQTIFMIQ